MTLRVPPDLEPPLLPPKPTHVASPFSMRRQSCSCFGCRRILMGRERALGLAMYFAHTLSPVAHYFASRFRRSHERIIRLLLSIRLWTSSCKRSCTAFIRSVSSFDSRCVTGRKSAIRDARSKRDFMDLLECFPSPAPRSKNTSNSQKKHQGLLEF